MGIPVRVLRPVGTAVVQRLHWGEDCPSCCGLGSVGYHDATGRTLATSAVPWDHLLVVPDAVDVETGWPTRCDHCPAAAPADAFRQHFAKLVLQAPGGERLVVGPMGTRVPGDMWPTPCWAGQACEWEDCRGTHWQVTLPDRSVWDSSSRASNCDQRADRRHRCWVLHGDPPHTADKQGHTCGAGGGSILTPRWHGHLVNGVLL